MFVIDSLGGKATPGKITNWIFREPHSVSSLLKAMEKKGLINRNKSKEGKNQIEVTLTPKGKAIFNKVDDIKSIKESLSILSEEEHDQLRSILTKLRQKVLITLANQHKLPFP
jgi:DNA-binding MarR family transcriptional regulator